jgi:hypothetical protein
MAPVLGIWASSFNSRTFQPTGSYDALATYTVPSGGVSDITFAGIPTGGQYTHLQIRYITRDGVNNSNTVLTFNGDTNANYSTHFLVGNGSSVSAGAVASSSFIYTDILTNSSTSYSGAVVDILDYASTSKNKTVRTLAGIDLNGSGTIWLASGAWYNASTPVNSIRLINNNANNFPQYSSFSLYGVKG